MHFISIYILYSVEQIKRKNLQSPLHRLLLIFSRNKYFTCRFTWTGWYIQQMQLYQLWCNSCNWNGSTRRVQSDNPPYNEQPLHHWTMPRSCWKRKEGRKEMFYLTTHSHFIYGYMASDMVKDQSDCEKGNPLPPHRLFFSINSKGSFICTIPLTG